MYLNNQVNALLFSRNNNISQINRPTIFKFRNILFLIIIIISSLSFFLFIYYFKIKSSLSSQNIISISNKEYLIDNNYNEHDININYFAFKSNILNNNNKNNSDKNPTYYQVTKEKFLYDKQKKDIITNLVKNNFMGTWESVIGNNTNISSDYLVGKSNTGNTIFKFKRAYERKSREEALVMIIKNNEGKYIDNWVKLTTYSLYQKLNTKVNLLKGTFEINGLFVTEFEKGEIFTTTYKNKDKCSSLINMSFPLKQIGVNATTVTGAIIDLGKIYTINPTNFTLLINSNCGFIFSAEIKSYNKTEEKNNKFFKLKIYLNLNIISSLLYVFGILSVICGIGRNEMRINALNIFALTMNSIWNFYCFASFIYISLKGYLTYFFFFLIISALPFLKFVFFDVWILITFWAIKDRNTTNICLLTKLKIFFYIIYFIFTLSSFFLIGSFFINNIYITIMNAFLWAPQIVHNIVTNNRIGLPIIYFLGCSMDRIIYPFFFRGFEDNFFMLKPNKNIFLIIIIIFIFNFIILLTQILYGPRFMLPKRYHHSPNNYYKNRDELTNYFKDINNEECVICLVPIVDEGKTENKTTEMKEYNSCKDFDKEEENIFNNIKNETDETDSTDNSQETEDKINNADNINKNLNQSKINGPLIKNEDDNNLLINDKNNIIKKGENNDKENNDDKNNSIQSTEEVKDEVFKIKENKNIFVKIFCFKSIIIKILLILKICIKDNFIFFYKQSSNIYNKLYMVTPCKHIFHSECLEKWLEHKKECPNCRASLEDLV